VTAEPVPCRPRALSLEVGHLAEPAFDLDRHGEAFETETTHLPCDIVLDLDGGTRVRIETYLHRVDELLGG